MPSVGSTAGLTGADGRLSDAVRLRRLRDTGMLGDAPYPSLDRLARAAAHQLRTQGALVSLLDAGRRVVAGVSGIPPRHTYCRLVLDTDAPLLIGDARTDERIGPHPAIGDGVIAYAGFPLRSPDGYVLGTFCVFDGQPREWEPRELLLIEDLAAAAGTEMELRTAARLSEQELARQRRAEVVRDLQLAVARVLADATTAEQAADGTVAAVARAMGWAFGEFWLVDDDAGTISRVGNWCDPGRDLSMVTGDRPFTLARGQGLAGHIWASEAELWATEVADDPRIVLREEQVREAGLHTAIGVPVRSDDRILGVLLFFSTVAAGPDQELILALDGVCAHLGRHIERRRAEQLSLALSAARREFDRVIAQVKDFVWTVEARPDGSVSWAFVSPDASGIFGEERLDLDDDVITTMHRRVHPDDLATFDAFCTRVLGGDPAEYELRVLGPDGTARWVWTRALPRYEHGRLLIDGISTNVTERRHLAEQREQLLSDQQAQNRQLRRLDRLKDELVAVVSHELRNPLAAIRSYSETLLEDPDLSADQRHLVEVVDRRSGHMQHLVDDLLDAARLETGQLHLDPQPISASRLIRDVVEAQRPAAAARSLTITVDTPRHLPVQADPVRLRQVLDNLVANAIKYTPRGGAIRVEAGSGPRAETTTVAVSDTGIGIPDDQYPQLFERFFRASNAVQQGIKGTGLGLAITKAIVEAHGGSIVAAPAPGGGTSFTVVLPAT
jgi:signal transduction histidine kinase